MICLNFLDIDTCVFYNANNDKGGGDYHQDWTTHKATSTS